MVKQEETYYLEYDTDAVFSYISKPENVAEVSPSLEDSRQIGVADNGGKVIEAEYSVGKGIAEGTAVLEPVIFQEPERIRYTIDDDIAGFIEWRFKQEDNGTKFEYEAEYTVEIPVPDFFMNTIGKHISQRELDTMVQNLRSELETA